jgi:hypothetical protein
VAQELDHLSADLQLRQVAMQPGTGPRRAVLLFGTPAPPAGQNPVLHPWRRSLEMRTREGPAVTSTSAVNPAVPSRPGTVNPAVPASPGQGTGTSAG